MIIIGFLLLAIFCAAALSNWRIGLPLCVVMALLQDVMRKLTPDEPAYYNLFVGLVFGSALIGCLTKTGKLEFDSFAEKNSNFRTALFLTLFVIFLQTVHSFVRFGQPEVSLIGLANYIAPLLAIIYIANLREPLDFAAIRKFVKFYLWFGIPAVFTVALQQAGFDSPVLGEVGVGIWITGSGELLEAQSGIFRAAEIAAWHVFTCCSLLILMATYDKPNFQKAVGTFLLVAAMVYIGTLTGRRKFVVMIAIFVVSYWGLMIWSSQRHRALAIILACVSVIAFLAFGGERFDTTTGYTENFAGMSDAERYILRTSGVFGDVQERFLGLGIKPISWAYTRTGFFGAGVGVGTQGVQHLGGFSNIVGGAAEGGLGRLMVELGVPGLVLVGLVVVISVQRLLSAVVAAAAVATPDRRFFCGLVAFAIANVASYTIAQGMFGDIFVLLFNGVIFGALLTYTRELQSFSRPGPRKHAMGQVAPVAIR